MRVCLFECHLDKENIDTKKHEGDLVESFSEGSYFCKWVRKVDLSNKRRCKKHQTKIFGEVDID